MKTCLVVDDSKILRKLVRQAMDQLGFTVLEAEHGEHALIQLRGHAIDAVILDGHMPVMDGLACLKAIRADAGIAKQPKIIFYASQDEWDKNQHAILAAADAHALKPFDVSTIADKLRGLGLL